MSADWDEVKRLAADFQRAQLSCTVQKLSERNCIEIVKKLIEANLIKVIFTTDGKEYLTPARLLKEINDELIVHGGRINLVDLAHNIGVDYSHVEDKAGKYLKKEPNTCKVLGELITNDYLDRLAEEINEKLHQAGQISIEEITMLYNLPGDFLERVINKRLGTIIHGQADSSDSSIFFTDSYVAQHTAKIKGALSALTRPVPLASIMNHFKFPEKLFYRIVDDLVRERRLAGSLSGGRSIFVPDIYAKSQNDWIDSFYQQNGYLEYDAVARLGIADAKSHLKKKFKDENMTFLSTCCVGQEIIGHIETTIEEALSSKTWVDIMSVLPSVFTPEDCQEAISAATKWMAKQGTVLHVYCDNIVVSDEFIKNSRASFDSLFEAKAKEVVTNSPHLFTQQPASKTISVKKESIHKDHKQERKEERRKKAASSGKSGGGTQGRETKTKSVKKKHGREVEDVEYDEEPATRESSLDLEFLSVTEIENHLKKLDSFQDCPEDFVSELASELYRPLTKKFQEVAKSLFESSVASSGASRRKQHAESQEKFSLLLGHIIMFEKSAKLFSDDLASQLHKHLQKTLCTDLANEIMTYLCLEHGVQFSEEGVSALTAEQRLKIINKFPDEIRTALTKLHNSLNAKTLEDFLTAVDAVLGAGVCDMLIRKPDKKKERIILSNHKQSLMAQLSEASEPALCLHLAVLLIFQSHTHNMLHASGKFVPHIIGYLQKQVSTQLYQLLATYQECVMKKLTCAVDGEVVLVEMMPQIKEAAITYRKTSVSESEN